MGVLISRVKRGFAAVIVASVVASGAMLVGPTVALADETPLPTVEETLAIAPVASDAELSDIDVTHTDGAETARDDIIETDAVVGDAAETTNDVARAADQTSVVEQTPVDTASVAVSTLSPLVQAPAALTVTMKDGTQIDASTPLYAGDEIVVRGSGFDPLANVSTRPPITVGDAAGVYVVFANFPQNWKPSAGVGSVERRAVVEQRWALTDATFANVDPRFVSAIAGERVTMDADGSFEFELELSDLAIGTLIAEDGSYGIYTYPGGGSAANPAEELEVRLNYLGERPSPAQLQVYLADGKTLAEDTPLRAGDEIVVRGSGFDPLANLSTRPPITVGAPAGVYVVFGHFAAEWQPSADAPSTDRAIAEQRWALTDETFDNLDPRFAPAVAGQRVTMNTDGSFEATLVLSDLDGDTAPADGGSFGVFTYPGGGSATNPTEELEVRLNYFSADEEFPVEDDEDEAVAGGLDWAFVDRWNSYAKGFANAEVTVSNGATLVNAATTEVNYVQVEGGDYDAETNRGTIRYQGTVRYVSQMHGFDIALADPWVEFRSNGTFITAKTSKSDDSGVSSMERVTVAQINAGAPQTGTGDDEELLIWSQVTGTIATTIEPAGWHQYKNEATAISPVSFSYGASADVDDEDGNTGEDGNTDGNTGDGDGDGGTETPVTPPPPATVSPAAGSLTWSISRDFAAYTTGTIGRGTVSTQGVGVGSSGYIFPQATGGSWNIATQTGTVQYSGVVTFTAHRGLMTETFANPVITVTSATSGTISVHGDTYALDLGAAQRIVGEGGEITFSGVPVNGIISGGGSSSGGTGGGSFATDSLTFTVGAVNPTNYGNTEVTDPDREREPAKTAPTTEGITIVTPEDEIVEGGEIEFTATGFEPNETDILVVIYSEPKVLDANVRADEEGNVRWIGTLPTELNGEHVITLQGSIDAGAEITILTQDEYDALHAVDIEARTLAGSSAEEIAETSGIVDASSGDSQLMWWIIALAVVVIAGGAVGVVAAKRRKSA